MSQLVGFYEKVITRYGFATFVAVFLLWRMATTLSGDIASIKTVLNEHVSETAHYLRGICLHTASNETERAECNVVPRSH